MFPCAAILASSLLAPPAVQAAGGVELGPWSLLGPFDCPKADVRTETDVDKLVKRCEVGAAWPGLAETFAGRGKAKLTWRRTGPGELPLPAEGGPFATGTLDCAALFGLTGAAGDNTAVYLYREITAGEAASFELSCGSDDGMRLWLNGELLLENTRPRGLNVLEEAFTLRLQPGTNHLLVKVANLGGAFAFGMTEPKPVSAQDINTAIDRGVDWLLARQLHDGSWGSYQDSYPSGQTALTLYTLLKSGVSPRHSAVQHAVAQLEARPAQRTYSLACQIFAVAALRDPARREWLAEMAEQLLDEQRPSGGWSYPDGETDLSNTQYAALALRAVAREGVEVPTKAWLELANFALRHQEDRRQKEAGFVYLPGHDTGYTGSMTTAGIAVLAIAREALGAGMPAQQKQAADTGIEAGVAWLAKHWSVSKNPNKGDYHLYYLYGVERVGGLLARDRIGAHDWYAEGSRYLVQAQEASGAWANSETETCFALLFLARSTAPVSGGVRDARLFATGPLPVCLRMRAGTPATVWIDRPTLDAGLTLARVEFFVRRVGHDWESLGIGDQALARSYAFPEPGAYELRAEAVLADGQRLVSELLPVRHDEGLTSEQHAAAGDFLRNRVPTQAPRARASSAAEPAEHAVDNRSGTRWLCEASDADPWLEIELAKNVTTARVLLTHARTMGVENEGANPRPARIELWLQNEKTPRLVELDPDPRVRTVIELDPPMKVSRLKLRIVAATDGELGAAALGFGEIELQEPEKKRGGK